jgi:hypothetical protein
MDNHEKALRTYEALQKRKKKKELQRKLDLNGLGWNGANKYFIRNQRNYYNGKHTCN